MRKHLNKFHVEGRVYDCSKLEMRVTGENSKNPGTVYIGGDLMVAIDEEALNVIPVRFVFVTEVYAKSQKPNATFSALKKIIEAKNEKSWVAAGKDNAYKVKIDGALALNNFFSHDGQRVAAKECRGSFVTIVDSLADENDRNTFQMDMVISKVRHVDANPERYINDDYTVVCGDCFSFSNEILPVEFIVRNPAGMNHFEDMDFTDGPVYTKVWGSLVNKVDKIPKIEESAFGEAAVTNFERKSREWIITGTAKVPYDFGDEEVLTQNDLNKARQDRELLWADIKARHDEYLASKNTVVQPSASVVPSKSEFKF